MSGAGVPVSLVPLTPERAEEAWNVYHAVFPRQWSREGFQSLLDSGQGLGALMDGALAGVILWREVAWEAELLTLALVEPARRQGIGRQLMDAMHEALRADEVHTVHLEVSEANEAARALYESLAYRLTGRRKGYYPVRGGAGVDALLFSRSL